MNKSSGKFAVITVILSILFVSLGMAGTVVPYFTKPEGRGYTWMEGFVDDYVGYVSYVKEGMYGANYFRIRSVPPPQSFSTVHLLYVWGGKLTGFLGVSAPVGYHLIRISGGILFFVFMIRLLLVVGGRKTFALQAGMLAALSTSFGYYAQGGYRVLTQFGFIDNVALRFASRPHYLFGALLFLFLTLINLNNKYHRKKWIVGASFVMGTVMGTMHPAFSLLLCSLSGVMILYRIVTKKTAATTYVSTVSGLAVGMAISYHYTHQYPTNWVLSFEEYVSGQTIGWQTIAGDLIAFGPVFWIGSIGIAVSLLRTKLRDEKTVYMAVWLILQLLFFFFLYKYFRAERVRFIQSLYFIPMAYGAVYLLRNKIIILTVILLLLPAFYHDFKTGLIANTDYMSYSLFKFPSTGMMDAYGWLDKNTPVESTVIASYEAANNILLYSHNYVYGNKQGWPYETGLAMEANKNNFFDGAWDQASTEKFLNDNNIRFVYKGYQETDGFLKNPFYLPVYQNNDVVIYKVSIQ